MRSLSTFSVLFWVYLKRARNDQAGLYVRININGQRANISLKQKVDIKTWDAALQRSTGKKAKARRLNLYIDEVKADIVQCHRDLKNERNIVNAQDVKARFLGETQKNHSLRDLFGYHTSKMADKLCAKSLCHYRTSQNYILEFVEEEYRATDYLLKNLEYSFLVGLEAHLRGMRPDHYRKRIGNNAVMKHIQRLRTMIKLAYRIGWIEKDPFIDFKPKLERTNREFLTESELQSIQELQPKIERLSIVKDLFVFSCYTGISYVDVVSLKREHLVTGVDGNPWIVANRNKTKNTFKVPLLPMAQQLIEKYDEHPWTMVYGTLMPKISNQRLNSYLKEIADLCGITKNLTFHMARHTFATTVTLSNGVPIETVSKLLGHTKLATTQIYARVLDRKIAEDMNLLRKELHNKGID